jgi:thiol-disulfide isomerase/thioredoxin
MSQSSKQWATVVLVIGLLVSGATALVKLNPEVRGVEIGAEAPEFAAVDLATADTVALPAAYRGKVTLVNVWATWCIPCREEMPWMQEVYADYKDQGFEIAAVSIDEGDPERVLQFQKELGLTFDILQDRSTRIQGVYQTTGVPESFLLDREGRIAKRVIGAYDWRQPVARQLIERLLSQQPTS